MLQATFLSNNCFEHLIRLIQNSKVGGAQAGAGGTTCGCRAADEQTWAGGMACTSVGGPGAQDGSGPHMKRVL